jgi:glycosyltransferase involved in cell wall biosynthesis
MKAKKTLFFFTNQYPLGQKSETFIENEIIYLAGQFEKIIVIPSEKALPPSRSLPGNVVVNEVLLGKKNIEKHFQYILRSWNRFRTVLQLYFYTIRKDQDRSAYLSSGYFLYYLANALHRAEILEATFSEKALREGVFYDYWFVNSTLSLALLKKRGLIDNFHCRAHGFDVFNERWKCGSVPFRQFIVHQSTAIWAISKFNQAYIRRKLNDHQTKVKVAYLGANAQKVKWDQPRSGNSPPFRMVSCATLHPFKQIHHIPQILRKLGAVKKKIHWVHFGDGQCESELLKEAGKLPASVEFSYRGQVENKEILEYYAGHPVDLFLSLSVKEGLPFSMIEAQSFGIPIMAYAIFGIPEIVNQTTGVLLDPTDSFEDISRQLRAIINEDKKFDKTEIYQHYTSYFNAKNNYRKFSKRLIHS